MALCQEVWIQITADGVTVDLNGFFITSVGEYVSDEVRASGVEASNRSFISVMRGTIQGMRRSGISVGADSRVENVSAVGNLHTGIVAGDRATLIGNVTTNNGIRGIWAGAGSMVRASIASFNGDGIRVGAGSTVSGNTTNDNTRVVESVAGVGIFVEGDGSTVTGNTARGNRGPGLVGSLSGYAHNVFTGNDWASGHYVQVSGGILQIGPNLCGTALCP